MKAEKLEISFTRLTKAQENALGNVAFGGHGYGCHPKTLAKLEERGLIVSETQSSADRLGTFTWKEWFMPLPVHIAFCGWLTAKYPDEETVTVSREFFGDATR